MKYVAFELGFWNGYSRKLLGHGMERNPCIDQDNVITEFSPEGYVFNHLVALQS